MLLILFEKVPKILYKDCVHGCRAGAAPEPEPPHAKK